VSLDREAVEAIHQFARLGVDLTHALASREASEAFPATQEGFRELLGRLELRRPAPEDEAGSPKITL